MRLAVRSAIKFSSTLFAETERCIARDERARWTHAGVDPITVASRLWKMSLISSKPDLSVFCHQGDVDFKHATTSGLFAAVRARQLADRSVG
jgi:hypothetical protein